MAIPRVSAGASGPSAPDADSLETPPFCQCCQVACHRFRPAKPCSVSALQPFLRPGPVDFSNENLIFIFVITRSLW
jgi:hypothetical protein